MKDMTVSKALKWLFIAEILTILSIIPLVGAILSVVAFVLNLVALYGASKLEEGYRTAFMLSIAAIVISVIAVFAREGAFAVILSILSTLVALGITYYVINTTVGMLKVRGASEVAAKGETVWKLNLICAIASVVLTLLTLIIPMLGAVLAIIVAIVEIVAYILYLIFLYKSYNTL